jgi:hypothetical protein
VAVRDPTTIVLWLLAAFAAVEAAAGLTLLIGGLVTGSALYTGGGIVLLAMAARTTYRRRGAQARGASWATRPARLTGPTPAPADYRSDWAGRSLGGHGTLAR